MKIILAIFAIACGAALFALWDEDLPPADAGGGIVAAVAGADIAKLPGPNLPEALAAQDHSGPNEIGMDAVNKLLRIASERVDRYSSIAALVRHRTQLFNSELIGSGLYQQVGQGSARRFRLELRTQVGDEVSSRLQVCDANALWTYRETPGGAQLEWLDLRRVRAAQRQAAQLPPNSPVAELATGGVPKLLEGLQLNFQTLKVEAGYLVEVPMWAIELEWKPSVLAALAPDQQERITAGEPCDFAELPQLPERVMIFLGHEDLFPRRIEFRRRASDNQERSRVGEGRGDEFLPAVTVEFTDVQLNRPIDPRQFEYVATGATDVTEAFLQSRGLPMVR
ncbi:MAG: hypothetical protein WD894_20045 [Pirellulales bacterium]